MAPMRTDGTAMTMHPNAARKERTWAYVAEEADRTLWKYTCQGIPPSICSRITGQRHTPASASSHLVHHVNEIKTCGDRTRRQKLSSQTQMSFLWTVPLQGDWYSCLTAVTVMSDTAGLVNAKGTLIH